MTRIPKRIKNKSTRAVNRFFNSMSNEERTHWYVNTYSKIAINEMKKYGIPASITMAQGILESNQEKEPWLESNNHFGIKCHKGWKGKKFIMMMMLRVNVLENIKTQKNHTEIIPFF